MNAKRPGGVNVGHQCALVLGIVLLTAIGNRSLAQELRQLRDLRGSWKFEIGDDSSRAGARFDDRNWVEIGVPAKWEDEGFPGYDGYGWYRKKVWIPAEWKGKTLYLKLGKVDDVDEVYLNGVFIAFTGEFPPKFKTAYSSIRQYAIPEYCAKFGEENLFAVRVYDDQLEGGITRGEVGLFEQLDVVPLVQNLGGIWRFSTGDSLKWNSIAFDDRKWTSVRVPAYWETQGFRGYDGFGWYRTNFRPVADLAGEHLVLLLGRIDDFDEVYLNGERIGKTGRMSKWGDPKFRGNEYSRLRAYTIPAGALRDGENTLAVRVFDYYLHGGIYQGPVGITTRERYLNAQRSKREGRRNVWDFIRRLFPGDGNY